MPIETEVKIKIENIEQIKQKLFEIRAELFKKRALQRDEYFDAKNKLKRTQQTLRLRDSSILCYKGPPKKKQNMKIREEIEVMVDNGNYLKEILLKLCYEPTKVKEKYRESYLFHLTRICIDETPMGNYLEIEGSKDGVLDAAKRLGFSEKDFNTRSYTDIWEEYAKKNKIKGDMVFPK